MRCGCGVFLRPPQVRCKACAVEYARALDTDRMLVQPAKETEMRHKHVGSLDVACTLCFVEAEQKIKENAAKKALRRNATLGIVFLIVGVLAAMAMLSRYLTEHGSHLQ